MGRVPYCAVFRFPGRKPFSLGTVWVDLKTPQHELMAAAEKLLCDLMAGILPEGTRLPDLVDLRQGQIIFVGDE